jgi:hypothetical protein
MKNINKIFNLLYKDKKDNTPYLIYSIFSIIFYLIIYIFNEIRTKEIFESTFYCCGATIFFIHFINLKSKFSFTFIIIIFATALFNSFCFKAIGFIGYFLFTKDIINSQNLLMCLVLSFFGIIIISGHIFGNSQCDPFYIYTLVNEKANCDLYFHSTIAANYKNFNYCTTALHDAPKFEYWSLTNLIASKVSSHFNIRSFDFYNLIFPGMIWGKLLFLLHYIIKTSLSIIKKHNSNQVFLNLMISFLMINVISMLVFKPTWGPIQNYFKWEIYSVFSVPLALVFIMTFFLALLEIMKINNNVLRYILFIFVSVVGFSLIFNIKLYLAHYIIGTSFVMIFRKQSTLLRNYCILAFLLSTIIYIYYHFNNRFVNTAFNVSFMDIWSKMLTESQILWSIFTFTFIPLVIIFLIKGNFKVSKNFISIKSFRNNFVIYLIIFLFILSFSPSILFGGPNSWCLLYYVDTFYMLMSFPLTIYLSIYIYDNFNKRVRFSFILSILFIFITTLTGIGSGIVSYKDKFKKNKITEGYFVNGYPKSTNDKDQLLQLTSTLNEIFYRKDDNSVLWIPYTNEAAWTSFDMNFDYGIPFVFTALSELPLIYGFPKVESNVLKSAFFGYESYSNFLVNYPTTLECVINEAKSKGYKNLYILESIDTFSYHKL